MLRCWRSIAKHPATVLVMFVDIVRRLSSQTPWTAEVLLASYLVLLAKTVARCFAIVHPASAAQHPSFADAWDINSPCGQFRPPDIPVDGLMFYHGFFFFLLYFCHLISTTCSEVSAIWKCMSKSGVSPPLPNWGSKNHLFRWHRNSTTNLTADIFGRKHGIDNRSSALTTTRGLLLHRRHKLWSTNSFKLDRHFYPPYVNITLLSTSLSGFADGHQQTELNQTLSHGGW